METAWEIEGPSWEPIIDLLRSSEGGIGFNYEIESTLGLGGAAVVFRVVDLNLFERFDPVDVESADERARRSFRALKVPRPHGEKGQILADSLRDELSRLGALSHPNIIPLYAKGQITLKIRGKTMKWPWFVMGYVHQATDLEKFCERTPPTLPILIRILRDVAVGMRHIHKSGIVHCDIKPQNVFVASGSGPDTMPSAMLADFGYAKYAVYEESETIVGFTEYFAHPDLIHGSEKGTEGSRTFNRMPRREIRPAFDLFAFGMMIQWLLDQPLYNSFEVHSSFPYQLKFLRLSSARLLDGLNHHRGITYGRLQYQSFADRGQEGTKAFEIGLKYRSAEGLVLDFNKLLGELNPEFEIPELTHTHRENIQVSDVAPVIYTDRLRSVVENRLVRRLGAVAQLGLVSLVYPGATHTRLEHALGTFGMTAKYMSSLYRDTLEPLFSQLVDTKTMKTTLIAALLHHIGYYPLAHDLEDVSTEFFSHERIRDKLLHVDTHRESAQAVMFAEGVEFVKLSVELDDTLQRN